jgi:hypothetical protein
MTPREAHDFHGFHRYDDRRVTKLKDQDPPYSVLVEQVKDFSALAQKRAKEIATLKRIIKFRDKTVTALQDKLIELRKDNDSLLLLALWGWVSVFLLFSALLIHVVHYGI